MFKNDECLLYVNSKSSEMSEEYEYRNCARIFGPHFTVLPLRQWSRLCWRIEQLFKQ
jgi:hypothetical protein